ncbi:DUF484 family protein [Tabrizicola sp.]|uniref:DUF484 family protein n=1 Tax=Tabrizicola sp. TaxID=2005166 RepID=UPI0035B0C286
MIEPDLRDRILAEPERILEDRDVMNALVAANDRSLGANIVDLRGIAMQRLESRLDRLEDTHRSVIAAAYENLAGTNQVHRAVLQLLEPTNFESFIKALTTEVAQTLRVDMVRLVLETLQEDGETDPTLLRLGDVLQVAPAGFVGHYLTNGRSGSGRQIVLRSTTALAVDLYGDRAEDLQSEALMKLDLGPGRLPGMLVFASEDPTQFKSTHGTDLLAFFAGVFERSMRRWLG